MSRESGNYTVEESDDGEATIIYGMRWGGGGGGGSVGC